MSKRLRPRLTFANVISCIALFVALGSGAYAATQLPKNSVGSKQIKKNAVNSAKVKDRSLKAVDFKEGQLPAGPRGPEGPKGTTGATGVAGTNAYDFPAKLHGSVPLGSDGKPVQDGAEASGWRASATNETGSTRDFVVIA